MITHWSRCPATVQLTIRKGLSLAFLFVFLSFGILTCQAIPQPEHTSHANQSPFSSNILVSTDNESIPGDQTHFYPCIAIGLNKNPYIIWTNRSGLGVSISKDSGNSISQLSLIPNVIWFASPRILADKNDILHVAAPDDFKLKYFRSVNEGRSFDHVINLTVSGRASYPSIALDENSQSIYIACWFHPPGKNGSHSIQNIYLFRSDDHGNTFVNLGNITSGGSINDSMQIPEDNCALCIDKNGYVNVVYNCLYSYFNGTNWLYRSDLFYIKSNNKGMSFSKPVKITDTPSNLYCISSYSNMVICPNGEIIVVWQDNRDNDNRIYYSFSKDEGLTFSKNYRLSNADKTNDTYPSICVDNSGTVHFVWNRQSYGSWLGNTIYINSTDKLKTFNKEIQVNDITNCTYINSRPSICVDKGSGMSIITWIDERDYNHTRNTEIYMSVGNTYFPDVQKIDDQIVRVGTTWRYQINVTRTSDSLTYGMLENPPGFTVSKRGEMCWTPDDYQVGSNKIKICICDSWGHNISSSYNITVVPYPKTNAILIFPHGGEKWVVGSKEIIKWNVTTNDSANNSQIKIKLEYSISGKKGLYSLIVENCLNVGNYVWCIPNKPSDNVYIKLTAIDILNHM